MTPQPVIDVRFDGRFTVTYRIGDDESAFRVVPELGRLIAAAPEMLALLEVFVRQLDDGNLVDATALGLDAHVVDARALLARIEGKETP